MSDRRAGGLSRGNCCPTSATASCSKGCRRTPRRWPSTPSPCGRMDRWGLGPSPLHSIRIRGIIFFASSMWYEFGRCLLGLWFIRIFHLFYCFRFPPQLYVFFKNQMLLLPCSRFFCNDWRQGSEASPYSSTTQIRIRKKNNRSNSPPFFASISPIKIGFGFFLTCRSFFFFKLSLKPSPLNLSGNTLFPGLCQDNFLDGGVFIIYFFPMISASPGRGTFAAISKVLSEYPLLCRVCTAPPRPSADLVSGF